MTLQEDVVLADFDIFKNRKIAVNNLSQLCQNCGRTLVPIFFSVECEWCKYGPGNLLAQNEGYTVIAPDMIIKNQTETSFVFASWTGANTFKAFFGNETDIICKVQSLHTISFSYRQDMPYDLQGSLCADHMYLIHPNHIFKPTKYDAFVVETIG
jgi:hypothetical protein